MSKDALLSEGQLRTVGYEQAKLYGMPHIGCRYRRDDVKATEWDDRYVACAVCGKVAGSKHHEPPVSACRAKNPYTGKVEKGKFLLETQGYPSSIALPTEWGIFVLKPALIALCGTGTTGCHGLRHARRLSISWEWDSDDEERLWWNGWYLSHGYQPHGDWLWAHGRYVFELEGVTWEYRKEIGRQKGFYEQLKEMIDSGMSPHEAMREMGIDEDG